MSNADSHLFKNARSRILTERYDVASVIEGRDQVKLDGGPHLYFNLEDHSARYTSNSAFLDSLFEKFRKYATIDRYYEKWQREGHFKYGGKSKAEIEVMWDEKRDTGTKVHEQYEKLLINPTGPIPKETPHMKLFVEALETDPVLRDLKIIYSEVVLYSDALKFAMTADAIAESSPNDPCNSPDPSKRNVYIIDWKIKDAVSGPVNGEIKEGFSTGIKPSSSDLMSCDHEKYRMQLHVEAGIAELPEYNMHVCGLINVYIHPDGVCLKGVSRYVYPTKERAGYYITNPYEVLHHTYNRNRVKRLFADRRRQLEGDSKMNPVKAYGSRVPSQKFLDEWGIAEW